MGYSEEFENLLLERVAERYITTRNQSNFPAAEINRLTASWPSMISNADSEIRFYLPTLRGRMRNLFATNDYARRFIKMCSINVIGKDGIILRNKAQDIKWDKKTNTQSPVPDMRANRLIEESFWQWGRKGCEVTGQLTFKDVQRLGMETIARDGEIIIRKIRGAKNPWGFAIQLLEADHLDESKTEITQSGNRIIMGRELDSYGKCIAYHLLKQHPGDSTFPRTKEYERVPAEDIIHPYIIERPSQGRGIPWMYTAATRLNHIGAYEMAALVHARIGASAMGIFTTPQGQLNFGAKDPATGKVKDGKDAKGNTILEVSPGMFINSPYGTDFKEFKPNYPDSEFPYFIKAMLRGVSVSLGVSYNALTSDLESVNFSSLREGSVTERDAWRMIQDWFIENVMIPIYEEWLKYALLSGQVPLPYAGYNKFNAPLFRARGWDWFDPKSDVTSDVLAIQNRLKSYSRVWADRGEDFEEGLEEIKNDEDLLKKYGLMPIPENKPEPKEKPKDDKDDPEKKEPATDLKDAAMLFVDALGQIVAKMPQPTVNISSPVNVTTPPVNVAAPAVTVEPAQVNVTTPPVTVNTPAVNVTTPPVNVAPAQVTVQAQPITLDVKLEQPKQRKTVNIKIEKDRQGNIAGIKREEN